MLFWLVAMSCKQSQKASLIRAMALPQPIFEIFAAVAKLIAAYVSVSWEALLGREAVAVARPSVVRMAWMHDGLLTLVTASLLVTHMGIQSLRGDAAGEFSFFLRLVRAIRY